MRKNLETFVSIQSLITTMIVGLGSVASAEQVQILRTSTMGYGSNKVENNNFVSVAKISCRQDPSANVMQTGRRGQCVVVSTVEGFTIYFGDFIFNFRNYLSSTKNEIDLLKSLHGNRYTDYSYRLESIFDRIYGIKFSTRTSGKQKIYLEPSLVARESDSSGWKIMPYDAIYSSGVKAKPSIFELEFDSFNDALRFFYQTR
jgi:hypothetical protein